MNLKLFKKIFGWTFLGCLVAILIFSMFKAIYEANGIDGIYATITIIVLVVGTFFSIKWVSGN